MTDTEGFAGEPDALEVLNQPGEIDDFDAFGDDRALSHAVTVFSADWAADELGAAGRLAGSGKVRDLANDANRYPPELRTYDRFGRRIDEVQYHSAYHELMGMAFGSGVHSLPWVERRAGAQVARAALSYLWNQTENGVCCPVAMTFASVAALRHESEQMRRWLPLLTSRQYDPRPIPAERKSGITLGMAMTEKQAGSDLRQTRTTARPAANRTGPGADYLLTGHKWFFSVPMSDLILTLAQSEAGLSCFLARGWLEDGTRNGLRLQRLKDKCGNRANASSEIEFHDLSAVMIGREGEGLRTILEVAHLTRLECAIGSAGVMRHALVHVLHHTGNRQAFGRRLIDQPIMRNVAADLALESEAALWMVMRLAAALDMAEQDAGEQRLARIGIPIAKYWICKRAPSFVAEAMEAHGGNGYVEEHVLARLFRESPLNGIWEGASNVICLDVMRAVRRDPDCIAVFLGELRQASGEIDALDRAIDRLSERLDAFPEAELEARRTVELMATAFEASLLFRHAPRPVAKAFCSGRLGSHRAVAFGTLPDGTDTDAILEHTCPRGRR